VVSNATYEISVRVIGHENADLKSLHIFFQFFTIMYIIFYSAALVRMRNLGSLRYRLRNCCVASSRHMTSSRHQIRKISKY